MTTRRPRQPDLADQFEVSRQTINAIETERYEPSLTLTFRLAKRFKVKIEDILEG